MANSTTPLRTSSELNAGAEQNASLIASVGSLIMLAVGGILGYSIYISGRLKPASIVGERGFARSLYNFLWNRWYLNPLYYRAFVYGTLSIAMSLWNSLEIGFFDKISGTVAQLSLGLSRGGQGVDMGVIDRWINGIAAVGRKFSSAVRRIQTGIPQEYVMVFALGLFALVVAILFFLT